MAEALYTAGLVARTDQRPIDIINELAEAMGGKVCFSGNQLRMRAAHYTAPVITLGDDDFAPGPVKVDPRVPREQLFNVVQATLLDPANGWQVVDMPRVAAAEYIAADGTELPLQVEYGAVNRPLQAQQLSAVALREARQALTFGASFKLTAYRVEVFDAVAINCTRYGWSTKPFLVLGRQWSIDGLIRLTQRETAASVYAFGNTFDAIDAAPNTTLPAYKVVPALVGLAVESGLVALEDGSQQTRVRVSFTPTDDLSVVQGGQVEVQFIEAGANFPSRDWPGQKEAGSVSEVVVNALKQNAVYVFRGRWITAMGVKGKWSTPQVAHQVAPVGALDIGDIGGGNLFANSSCETDSNADGMPDGWVGYQNATPGTVTYSRTATGAVHGSYALDITATALGGAGSGDQAGIRQTVNVASFAGRTAAMSAYVRAGSGTPKWRMQVDYYTAGGVFISSEWQAYTPTAATITRIALKLAIPANAAAAWCYAWIQEPAVPGSCSGQIDALQFEIGDVITGYAPKVEGLDDLKPLQLLARGSCEVNGITARKVGGAAAWDSDVYSRDSYTGGAFASASPAQANAALMFGLNSDPTSDQSYTSLDYAFYIRDDGLLDIYESGVSVGLATPYAAGDALGIVYDGDTVRYSKNGTELRNVTAAPGLKLFWDSSFISPGAQLNSIGFGPQSAVTDIATRQIQPGAVSQVQIVKNWSGPSLFDWTGGSNATVFTSGLPHTITADADGGDIAFAIAGSVSFEDNDNTALVGIKFNLVLERLNAADVVQASQVMPLTGALFVTPDSTPYNTCSIPFSFHDQHAATAGEVIKYRLALRNLYAVNGAGAAQTPSHAGPGEALVVLRGTASARELKV